MTSDAVALAELFQIHPEDLPDFLRWIRDLRVAFGPDFPTGMHAGVAASVDEARLYLRATTGGDEALVDQLLRVLAGEPTSDADLAQVAVLARP